MKPRVLTAASCTVLALSLVGSGAARAEEETSSTLPLHKVTDVPLSGRPSRLDYQSLDEKTHLLFVAHLGDGVVHVYNTETGKIVADIPEVQGVHGVLVVPELGRCYASATDKNEIVSIDEKTLEITARIPGGVYPDGMAYDPNTKKLYVSDENGATETVIDTSTQKRVATIKLGGEVGNSQYDAASKHIFVNIQTTDELVEIDPAKDEIVSRTPLQGSDGNHGLLIDAERRLALVACEGNSKLLVVDMTTMKVTSSFSVGKGVDVLAADPGLRWVYASSESGLVSIFELGTKEKPTDRSVRKIAEALLAKNAHTVAVDTTTHKVYFPLKDVGGKPILRVLEVVTEKQGAMAPAQPKPSARGGDEPGDGDDQEEVQQKLDELQAAAVKALGNKSYEKATKLLESALELVAKLPAEARDDQAQLAHYNLACALSLSGKKATAVEHFARSVELGFHDWEHIDQDTDLDNIRNEAGFKQAIEKAQAPAGKKEAPKKAAPKRDEPGRDEPF